MRFFSFCCFFSSSVCLWLFLLVCCVTFLLQYPSKLTSHTHNITHTHIHSKDTLNRNKTIHKNYSLLSQIKCRIIENNFFLMLIFCRKRHYIVLFRPIGFFDAFLIYNIIANIKVNLRPKRQIFFLYFVICK